jgi:hypothetical protein
MIVHSCHVVNLVQVSEWEISGAEGPYKLVFLKIPQVYEAVFRSAHYEIFIEPEVRSHYKMK